MSKMGIFVVITEALGIGYYYMIELYWGIFWCLFWIIFIVYFERSRLI